MKAATLLMFLFVLVSSGLAQSSKKPAAGTTGQWTGELVDLYCYTGFNGKGAVHRIVQKFV